MEEAVKLIPEKFLAIKKEFESNVWNFKFDVGEAIIKAVRDAAVRNGQGLAEQDREHNRSPGADGRRAGLGNDGGTCREVPNCDTTGR